MRCESVCASSEQGEEATDPRWHVGRNTRHCSVVEHLPLEKKTGVRLCQKKKEQGWKLTRVEPVL